MIRNAWVVIYENNIEVQQLLEKIQNDAKSIKAYGNHIHVYLSDDGPGYHILLKYLKEKKLHHSYAESRDYSSKEIKQAKYFNVQSICIDESKGFTADDIFEYSNTRACIKCGMGKDQVSDLKININKFKDYDLMRIMPEHIVSKRFYDLIRDNNLTGCEFRPVVDIKNRPDSEFYQLVITNVLPPMSDKVRLEYDNTNYCDLCRRSGVYIRSELIYAGETIQDAEDFNYSCEYYGAYPHRQLIISRKVYELFKAHKLKGRPHFEPVRII